MAVLVEGENKLDVSLTPIPWLYGKGDVNGDGKVADSDVRALQMLLEGTVTLQGLLDSAEIFKREGRHNYESSIEAVLWRCDINDDRVIDDRDLALLEEKVGYRWRDILPWEPIHY